MRKDIHSPKNFKPEDYLYIGSFDNFPEAGAFIGSHPVVHRTPFGQATAFTYQHALYLTGRALLKSEGVKIHFTEFNSGCDHCGARIRYVTLFKHSSGEIIAVGDDCATNRFGCDSRREYDIKKLKQDAKTQKEYGKVFAKAVKFLDEKASHLKDWMLSSEAEKVGSVFADITRKLIKYGTISDKALSYADTLLQLHLQRLKNGGKTDKELEIEAEKAAAAPCPSGRATVKGRVIKLKESDTRFGTVIKMLVKDDSGFVVYVTKPSEFDAKPEDRVAFIATIEPSKDDKTFGYGSRPKLISEDNKIEEIQ